MPVGKGVLPRDGVPKGRAAELNSEWVYRVLLILYPYEHRREYGEQMVQLFRDRMRRDGSGYRTATVWFHILSDLLRSALNEHLERGGYWGIAKALLFPSTRYSAQKAQTNGEVAGLLLLPGLWTAMVLGVALIVCTFVDDAKRFREAIINTGAILLPMAVLVNPLIAGMTFRLRLRYDLRRVLLAIAIYWPIHMFVTTTLFHSFLFFFVADKPASDISEVSLFFGSIAAVLMCIVPVLGCLSTSSRIPAPSIAAHRYFRQAEIGLFLTALLGIGTILLLVR